jgi:hypothetical protein
MLLYTAYIVQLIRPLWELQDLKKLGQFWYHLIQGQGILLVIFKEYVIFVDITFYCTMYKITVVQNLFLCSL